MNTDLLIIYIRNSRDIYALTEFCKEFGGEFEREANKKKHSFKLDFNIAFGEYKDGLCKDGIISQSLYERATLY